MISTTENAPTATENGLTVTKCVKYVFTEEEKKELGAQHIQILIKQDQLEDELQEVKSSYKAQIDAAVASERNIRLKLQSGFEMRDCECTVEYRPKERKKLFRTVGSKEVVLEEVMTQNDFQLDLIQAESRFDNRADILLSDVGNEQIKIVVGKAKDKWYAAIRGNVGTNAIDERLSTEGKAFTERFEAIRAAAKRGLKWLKDAYPEDYKGFKAAWDKKVEEHKERVE